MSAKSLAKNIVRILVPFFMFGFPALALEWNFKLSGGYAYLGVEGINRGIDDWAKWLKKEAEQQKNWGYVGQNVQSLKSGIHLEGEILLSFSPHLGISLGTGYIYGDLKENETDVLVLRPSGILSQVYPITVSAYPLVLSGYYFFPLNNRFHVYARGGGGLAWAKYVYREAKKLESKSKRRQ